MNSCRELAGKPGMKRQLGIYGLIWEDNIEMNLKETQW
jgi:hypothetical protein